MAFFIARIVPRSVPGLQSESLPRIPPIVSSETNLSDEKDETRLNAFEKLKAYLVVPPPIRRPRPASRDAF